MTEVAFGLIGPLDIRCSGQVITIPAPRQRTLLAALLLRANQPVAKHNICETVWAGRVPDRAEITLRSYVMRLRRGLGPILADRLVVQAPGYLLRLEGDDELDLLRLQGCIKRGRAAGLSGDWERSMREFSDGLALWRGEPLCDVPSDSLHLSVIPTLSEHRTQVWEGLYAAALRLGRAAEFVVPLQSLVAEDPLSERFSALLMSALASCSRRIDALAEFRRLRQALIREQGMEPGRMLRELHQRLLRDEGVPGGEVPAPRRVVLGSSGIPVPRQLPRGAAVFAGRAREADELARDLAIAPGAPGPPRVTAVTGVPGIGKSELAIQVAHRLAGRYPGGQLFADLRGSRDDPAAPGEIVGQFLRALGVNPAAVARDEAERVSQYRSLLSSRRILVVLDDALDACQVRPLIPGSGACGVLVTARQCMAHLPEARSRVLGQMSSAGAGELLRALAGAERVSGEPAAVSSIVASCGGVPLALCMAGARLAARPGAPIGHFARLLADEHRRLDELAHTRTSVRTSLEAACRRLVGSGAGEETDLSRAFRLVGGCQCEN